MNETRQFLRYITPGLVFATETGLLLWILFPDWAIEQVNRFDGVGTLLGALFVSGGLGFIFSVMHHQLHWWWRWTPAAIDYRPCIERLRARGVLALRYMAGGQIAPWTRALTRQEAWILVSALWDERRDNKFIEASDAEVAKLNDLYHSMGTARVAAWLSPVVVFAIGLHISPGSECYG